MCVFFQRGPKYNHYDSELVLNSFTELQEPKKKCDESVQSDSRWQPPRRPQSFVCVCVVVGGGGGGSPPSWRGKADQKWQLRWKCERVGMCPCR